MENYVEIGSVKLWTVIDDDFDISKPYLCLCGGGPGISDSLYDVNQLLRDKFNVIRFEQRGCGRSTADGNYQIEAAIDDLDCIRKHYGISRWFILGHSWGAGLALFYALRYKSNCLGVVYVSGMGIQNDNDWAEEFNKNVKNLSQPEFVLPPSVTINYDVLNIGLRSFNDFIKTPTLLRDISILKTPVLIIYGKQDIRPMWPAVQLANLLPDCQINIFDDGNHFTWQKEPVKFKKIIFDWIDCISKKEKWWTIIKQVAYELTSEKIPYHFDASTSLFVNGIDIEMDDIDITVQWNCFVKAHSYYKKYGAGPIQNTTFSYFFVMVDNVKLHFLSSERCSNFEEDSERVMIKKDHQIIWSKLVEFYRRHHSDDHPLAALIDEFLDM